MKETQYHWQYEWVNSLNGTIDVKHVLFHRWYKNVFIPPLKHKEKYIDLNLFCERGNSHMAVNVYLYACVVILLYKMFVSNHDVSGNQKQYPVWNYNKIYH